MSQPARIEPEVPPHLRRFVVDQHYDLYTPVDHAVWRYVMRQNLRSLEGRSHPAYHQHFFETGMDRESIPDVSRMNQSLLEHGWSVVAVDGFIPPGVFLDFQAHGFMPVAQDIRTLGHVAYTPAPDIIHEAAGHAPLILDPVFGQLIRLIGEIGARAISYREDYEVYEAIRELSISKENPHATPDQLRACELELDRAIAASVEVSEATLISRLYWWTVEYGLIGDLEHPRIYGAGLLSSMSEGNECLKDHIKKIPFSLDCIRYSYDITRPQPQLFVVKDFAELFAAVQEFAAGMAYVVGGTESLKMAVKAGRVSTMVYDSGLQISGQIDKLELDEQGEAAFAWIVGPTALAVRNVELPDHGIDAHPSGIAIPIGRMRGWSDEMLMATDLELSGRGTTWGTDVRLELESGLEVTGRLEGWERIDGRIALLKLANAEVRRGERLLHAAASYDMPVGASIVSVFSGSADKHRFVVERQRPRFRNAREPSTELEVDLNRLYGIVRKSREQGHSGDVLATTLREVLHALEDKHPHDWLLRLELLELAVQHGVPAEQERLVRQLETLQEREAGYRELIGKGLALIPGLQRGTWGGSPGGERGEALSA